MSTSRVSDLLRQVEKTDPHLAGALRVEYDTLGERRSFGLNFERHMPESVELPGRPVRRGDKVSYVAERGASARALRAVDRHIWAVAGFRDSEDGRVALLQRPSGPETVEKGERLAEDLVVVAEFRDPIYPGLCSTGRVQNGEDKPFHTVINAENFHALETLLYTHEGKVDVIYIDPPYNSRANDWKYNNDFVDPEDAYAHSKWLAFLERRLKLAHRLLNPDCSTLIVTIDEKEYLRLGLLLEQTFPEANIEMVTAVISAKGAVRPGRFSRVEENIFFVMFGDAQVRPWVSNMLPGPKTIEQTDGAEDDDPAEPAPLEWLGLRRREPTSVRGARPNQFYPVFVMQDSGHLHSVGDPLEDSIDRTTVPVPAGTVALWPLKPNGTEMLWGLTPDALRENWRRGFARVKNWRPAAHKGLVQYLPSGTIAQIERGEITLTGRAEDGSAEGHANPSSSVSTPPKRVWNMRSHNAETGGTNILTSLIPGRRFPFPKSLFAVEDALRFVVANKPDAVILDFFAGSGTTAHAVMRLNRQDGGRRQSISVTNNEVSSDEARRLRGQGLRPGDADWEALGICEHITKPRLQAAISGLTPDGEQVAGSYRFTDEFEMSDGFAENVEFFTMTYQAPRTIAYNRSFETIAPLLWLKAGACGSRIKEATHTFAVADTYAVLFDLDHAGEFARTVAAAETITTVFIVSDDEWAFRAVCEDIPPYVEAVRLYSSYLESFKLDAEGRD